jgi:hypothetical protein
LYSTSTPTNTKTTQPYPTQREAKEEGAKTVAADDPVAAAAAAPSNAKQPELGADVGATPSKEVGHEERGA